MTDTTTAPAIVAMLNNAQVKEPCSLCGFVGIRSERVDLFLDGKSWVCHSCGETHAPKLTDALDWYNRELEFLAIDKWFRSESAALECAAEEKLLFHSATEQDTSPLEAAASSIAIARGTASNDAFGSCPRCRRHDGYLNIGRGHWFYCRRHRVRWFVGANLFDSWKHETEAEQRARYDELDFGNYRETEA